MTVDGFGAAMWERCAQSQGFGIFGPRHAGGGIPLREGGGGGRRTENRDHTGIRLGVWGLLYIVATFLDYLMRPQTRTR